MPWSDGARKLCGSSIIIGVGRRALHCQMVECSVLGPRLSMAHRVVEKWRCTLYLPRRRARRWLWLKHCVRVSNVTVEPSCELQSSDENGGKMYLWGVVEDAAGSSSNVVLRLFHISTRFRSYEGRRFYLDTWSVGALLSACSELNWSLQRI